MSFKNRKNSLCNCLLEHWGFSDPTYDLASGFLLASMPQCRILPVAGILGSMKNFLNGKFSG